MSQESIRKRLGEAGSLPGLSGWQKDIVLLLRCQDITKTEFTRRVQALHEHIENLYQLSLPESMDEETYLVAQSYYDASSDGLDAYLAGLECLMDWVKDGDSSLVDDARSHFALGDKLSREAILLGFETQESFRENDEALLQSLSNQGFSGDA